MELKTNSVMVASGSTVQAAVTQLSQLFKDAGLETPSLDARLLIAGGTSISREEIMAHPGRVLSDAHVAVINSFAERRLGREPVSRILGRRAFYGRDFEITPATLDPRPETELIVEHVSKFALAENLSGKSLRILDIGTGSGVLLVTLLAELANASGVGTDVSESALDVATRNAKAHGVAERSDFCVLDGVGGIDAAFDILVCNPPYIPSDDIAGLMADVREFDPRLALDGGIDGLEIYRRLAGSIAELVPNGLAVFEVGAGQAADVAALLAAALPPQIAPNVCTIRDLGGHERCVAVLTHS